MIYMVYIDILKLYRCSLYLSLFFLNRSRLYLLSSIKNWNDKHFWRKWHFLEKQVKYIVNIWFTNRSLLAQRYIFGTGEHFLCVWPILNLTAILEWFWMWSGRVYVLKSRISTRCFNEKLSYKTQDVLDWLLLLLLFILKWFTLNHF